MKRPRALSSGQWIEGEEEVGRTIRRKHLPKKIKLLPCYEIMMYRYYPQITNYVVTLKLGVTVELRRIAMYLANTERRPTFAAIIMRINETTCLLFTTGNMVITGAKSYESSKLAAHLHRLAVEQVPQPMCIIHKDGTKTLTVGLLDRYTRMHDITVVNVVGSGHICHRAIDLMAMKFDHSDDTEWNPEIFPALRWEITQKNVPLQSVTKATAHVFDTGLGVVMGVRTPGDVYLATNFLSEKAPRYIDPYAPMSAGKRYIYRRDKMFSYKSQIRMAAAGEFGSGSSDSTLDAIKKIKKKKNALARRLAREVALTDGSAAMHPDDDDGGALRVDSLMELATLG